MPLSCLTCLTKSLSCFSLLSAQKPEGSCVRNALRAPFTLRGKAHGLPVLYKALWALLCSTCLLSSPPGLPGPPLLCSSHTGLLTIPPQARPTPGHLHILCSLPGMHLTPPWLTPSLPLGLRLSIIPSLATWCKIPTLPIPFPCFLFLWVMCCALYLFQVINVCFPHLNLSSRGQGSDLVFFWFIAGSPRPKPEPSTWDPKTMG